MPIGIPQACSFCGTEFIPSRNKSLFCNRKCKDAFRNRSKPRKTTKSVLKARELKENPLTQTELDVLYGSLLGDGSLINTAHGYRFSLCHSEDQLDYMLWKKSLTSNLFMADPSRAEKAYKGYRSVQYHLHSIHHPELESVYHLFFEDGKRKPVSKEILDLFSPLSLAVWYMDDGSYNKNENSMQVTWSTDSLTKQENELIIEWFKERHDIEIKLQLVKGSRSYGGKDTHRLRINRTQVDKLFNLIRPYICSTMLYKIK